MAATRMVPAMPVVRCFASVAAPEPGPINSAADVGELSDYCARLHKLRELGADISYSVLGDAVCNVHRAIQELTGEATEGLAAVVKTELKKELAAELEVVKAELATKLEAMKAEMEAKLVCIMAMTQNNEYRRRNSRSRVKERPLEPLKAEAGPKVGQFPPPGMFPKTPGDVAELSSIALDDLATFYGRPFPGDSDAARQDCFKDFIGVD